MRCVGGVEAFVSADGRLNTPSQSALWLSYARGEYVLQTSDFRVTEGSSWEGRSMSHQAELSRSFCGGDEHPPGGDEDRKPPVAVMVKPLRQSATRPGDRPNPDRVCRTRPGVCSRILGIPIKLKTRY